MSTNYSHINVESFVSVNDVLCVIAKKRAAILKAATELKICGKSYSDQLHPVEILELSPQHPIAQPLLLIGGMGPLAGLDGFAKACQIFQETRQIILVQACNIPCRTKAILEKTTQNSTHLYTQVVIALAQALIVGMSLIQKNAAEAIVLCNTAHYFLPDALQQFQASAIAHKKHLQSNSLITAAVSQAKRFGCKQVLILATQATHSTLQYTNALCQHHIKPVVACHQAQKLLEAAIFDGVKAQNVEQTQKQGSAFFDQLENQARRIDGIILGCTEIPYIFQELKSCNHRIVNILLSNGKVIDPIDAALKTNENYH